MEQAKHTPGTWHQGDDIRQIKSGNGIIVCNVSGAVSNPSVLADALLIAAAPELFDSHEPEREGADFLDWIADRLVHVYGESENVDFVICLRRRAAKARAAIKKATGA